MTQNKLRVRGVNSGGGTTYPIITFTKENYGTNVDVVSQYLTLKRGDNQGLFNTNEGGSYSQTVLGGVRHLWMSEPMVYTPHVEGTVNIGKTYPTDLYNLLIFFIYNGMEVSTISLGSFVNGNSGFEMTIDENGDSIVTINSNPWNDQLITLPSFDINDYEIVLKVLGENGWEVYSGENTINLTYTPPQLSNYFSSLNYWQENLWSTFDPSSIDVQQLVNTIGDGTSGSFGGNWPTLQMVPWQIVHNANPPMMIGKEMIMLDVFDGKFYKVKFTQWTQKGNGGGLSYTRQYLGSAVVPTTTTTTTMAPPQFNTSSSYFIDSIETALNVDRKGTSLMSYLALNTSNISSYILSSGIIPQKLTVRVISIMGNETQFGEDYSLADKQTGDVLQTVNVSVLKKYSQISDYSDFKLQILYNDEEILESRSLFNGTIEGGTEPLDKVYTISGFDSTSNGYIDSIIGGYATDNSLTWDGTYNFVVNGEMNSGKYFYFLDGDGFKQLLNTDLNLPLHMPLVGDEIGKYDYLFNIKEGKTDGIGNLFTITYIEDYVEPTLADDEFSGYLTDDNYLVEGSGTYVTGGGSTTTTTTEAPTTTTTTTLPIISDIDVISSYLTLEKSNNGLYNSTRFGSYDTEINNITTALDITHLWAMEWDNPNGSSSYRVNNLWSTFEADKVDIDQLVLNVRSNSQNCVLHTFKEVLGNAMTYYGGVNAILNKDLIMLDVFDRKFYKITITNWDAEADTFDYNRELLYDAGGVAPGYLYRFNDFRSMQELWGEDSDGNSATLLTKKWSTPFSLPNSSFNVVEAIVRSYSPISKGVGLNSYGQPVDTAFVIFAGNYNGSIPYFIYDFSEVSNSQTTNSQYFVDQFSANGITNWDGTRRFVVQGNTVLGNQLYYIGVDNNIHLMNFANEISFSDESVKIINDSNGIITSITTTGGQHYSKVMLFNVPTTTTTTTEYVSSIPVVYLEGANYTGGDTWVDEQGNYNGTLMNNPTYTDNVFLFDHIDDYVNMSSIPDSFWNGGSWTVSAWVKFNGVDRPLYNDNGIVGHGQSGSGMGLQLGERQGHPLMAFWNNDLVGNSVLSNGVWYNITYCFNKENGLKQIYVNGGLDVQGYGSYNGYGNNTMFGNQPFGGDRLLNGYLNSIKLFDKVLSPYEIGVLCMDGMVVPTTTTTTTEDPTTTTTTTIPYDLYSYNPIYGENFAEKLTGTTDWDGTTTIIVEGPLSVGSQVYYLGTDGDKHLITGTKISIGNGPNNTIDINEDGNNVGIITGMYGTVPYVYTTSFQPQTVKVFKKANYGTGVDVVSQYLTLKRGNNQGLFNSNEGSAYTNTFMGGVNHLWAIEDPNLGTVTTPSFYVDDIWNTFNFEGINISELQSYYSSYISGITFTTPGMFETKSMVPWNYVHGGAPLDMLNKEAIMLDVLDGKFYKVKFTQWTGGNNGGGLSYTRQLIV